MKQNLLVTLADEKFVLQAKQLFSSAYWNGGWSGDFMLLSHNIPEEKLTWFLDKNILVKRCKPIKSTILKLSYEPVVLDKFYLFTEEFKKWKNIIYLDSDIIVRLSLEDLLKVKHFAAVQDSYNNLLNSQFFETTKQRFSNQKINFRAPAFNSGVMAFNSDVIKPNTFNDLIHIFNQHAENSKFGEQPSLNLYFYKKWEKLPPLFNLFITSHGYKLPKTIKFIVIHFFSRFNEFPPIWENKNPYFLEWKSNIDRANFIDVTKIQKVKHLNKIEIKYNTLLLKLNLFKRKAIIIIKLTYNFLYYKINHFYFFLIRLLLLPNRILGNIGQYLIKHHPNIYRKLKRNYHGK